MVYLYFSYIWYILNISQTLSIFPSFVSLLPFMLKSATLSSLVPPHQNRDSTQNRTLTVVTLIPIIFLLFFQCFDGGIAVLNQPPPSNLVELCGLWDSTAPTATSMPGSIAQSATTPGESCALPFVAQCVSRHVEPLHDG